MAGLERGAGAAEVLPVLLRGGMSSRGERGGKDRKEMKRKINELLKFI